MREMLSPPTRRVRLLRWRKTDVVIDIGANEGQYATRLRQAGFAGRTSRLFDEVISFLDDRGFALVSLEGIDEEPVTGQMLQVDAIFMRRPNGDRAT